MMTILLSAIARAEDPAPEVDTARQIEQQKAELQRQREELDSQLASPDAPAPDTRTADIGTADAIKQEKAKLEAGREELAAELAPVETAAPDGDTSSAIERQKAKLDRERQELARQFELDDAATADEERRAVADAQAVLAPVGLAITSPPGPSANELFDIRAEQVSFRNVALCLAQRAGVGIRLADGIHSSILNEPVSADLRLASVTDALEILSGEVGLTVDSGVDAKGKNEFVVTQREVMGADLKTSLEQKAVDVWTRLLLKYPDDARAFEAYFKIAEIHFNQKEYALASQDYRLAIEKDTAGKLSPKARLKLGQCYSELGDYKAAAKVLYEFLDAAPAPADACLALLSLARAAAKAGEPNEAIRAYSRLLLEFGTSESAPLARLELADVAMRQQEYESALRHYQTLKQASPAHESRLVAFKTGLCRMKLEQWSPAAAEFASVLKSGKQDKLSADSYYRLAECLDNRGTGELEVLEAYVGAAARFPDHPSAPAARGRAIALYRKAGLLDRAIAYGEQIMKIAPDAANRPAKLELAQALMDSQKFDRARTLFEELAQSEGDGVSKCEAMLCAGEAAAKLEQYDRAEVLLHSALQLQPKTAERTRALRVLGDCYLARGQYQRAALAYQGVDTENKQ